MILQRNIGLPINKKTFKNQSLELVTLSKHALFQLGQTCKEPLTSGVAAPVITPHNFNAPSLTTQSSTLVANVSTVLVDSMPPSVLEHKD